MSPYVAPARYVLTVLHRQNPAIPPVAVGPDPSDGATVCGLPMLRRELWQPVESQDGELLCTGCMPGADAVAQPDSAEETLW